MALYKLTSHNDEKNLSVILETQNYRTLVLTHDNMHFESILELLESEENGTQSTEHVEQEIINLVDENQSIAKLLKEIDPELTLGEYNKIFYKEQYRVTPADMLCTPTKVTPQQLIEAYGDQADRTQFVDNVHKITG